MPFPMYTVLTTSNVPDDYSLPHISKYHDQRFVPYYTLVFFQYKAIATVLQYRTAFYGVFQHKASIVPYS
jgi:hypothetical protein